MEKFGGASSKAPIFEAVASLSDDVGRDGWAWDIGQFNGAGYDWAILRLAMS